MTDISSLKAEEKHVSRTPEGARLVDGPERCYGKLQLKSTGSWASVCSVSFSSEAALVACRDLGCGFADTFYERGLGAQSSV
ncbi:hypothetical protein CesoFtcFv8_009543 [Champsocephalus esox]|uniref:SRCR domain-containing protein n=1 Tax=Champsocephalus esox TaxID=159716 RepID=A0AAN8CAT2_9TELE|nr:hypothetical protein CesoFtcFv8_009543 [Champsocephalus esox]